MAAFRKSWKQHYLSQLSRDKGNKNLEAFTLAMASSQDKDTKVSVLTEDADTVFLAADKNKSVVILHSLRNLGRTMNWSTNKIVCLVGNGPQATCVLLNEMSALKKCEITTPKIEDISECA